MATVVLTTLGSAVGGPVGSALGRLAGRTIDGAVFGSRTRQGPRLRELQVQTSSYGTAIPRLFGTMRVAGTVIWATDLRESAATGGSKTSGRTTNYSYSASFAVALSARPIRGVRRIWAEGKLLRGAAGDWKTRTGFRLHRGDEAQAPDPLVESIVGIGNAPAYRGIAYAVFEDLALADYGNRIPSLTFEVEADPGPVSVGAVVEALGDGAVAVHDAGPMLGGYAAEGDSVRAAIEALSVPAGGWFAPAAGRLALHIGTGPARALPVAGDATPVWKRPPAAPADVTVAYHEAARDYQLAVQQVRERGARIAERIDLPAVLDPAVAAGIAGDAARRRALGGMVRTLRLDWRAIDIVPGTRVTLADAPGVWRVRRSAIEATGVTIELVPIAPATLPPVAAQGSARVAADVMPGATRLLLLELPGDGPGDAVPGVFAVAAGTAAGWRRATLLTGDAALGLREQGASAAPGIIGRAAGALPDGPTTLVDDLATVEVVLLHDAMTLSGADDAALDRGANAARIGDEIVQFAAARRVAPARWRLSRLWRGRRGTEWAAGTHRAGDPFALLDPATLRRIDDPTPAIGRGLAVTAVGIAPDDVAQATIVPDGRGVVPPAPVHGTMRVTGAQLALRWVRRGRIDAGWNDAVDVPLGEEREAWRVTLTTADGTATSFDSDMAELTVPRPEVPATIAIRQIGTHGASPPLILHLPSEIPA